MHGHITSLAVARTHRKLGIATRLMQASREAQLTFGDTIISAHVLKLHRSINIPSSKPGVSLHTVYQRLFEQVVHGDSAGKQSE